MRSIIEIRGTLQNFINKRKPLFTGILRFIIAVIMFYIINRKFGYMEQLMNPYIPLVLAAVCAFVPFEAMGFLGFMFITAHLLSLSLMTGLIAAVLGLFLLAISNYFSRTGVNMLWAMPLCYNIGIPCAPPVIAGYAGELKLMGGVVCGSVYTYYLKAVAEYAGALADETASVTPWGLLIQEVFGSSAFYTFLVAMVALTIIVNTVRRVNNQHAWLYASIAGLSVEFLIRISGVLFVKTGLEISQLLIDNLLTAAIAAVVTFFSINLDYSRTEHVHFEDDDYYYYVRAIPKAKISKAKKKVTNVTRDTSALDFTQTVGAMVEVSDETMKIDNISEAVNRTKKKKTKS